MMRLKLLLILVVSAIIAADAGAYVEVVHRRITERAAHRARIDYAGQLGIDPTQNYDGKTPPAWMSDGAYDEDALIPIPRSLFHFLDPVHGDPTYGAGLTVRLPLCYPVGLPADLWATVPGGVNHYNLWAAPAYYYHVVMGPNPGVREGAVK